MTILSKIRLWWFDKTKYPTQLECCYLTYTLKDYHYDREELIKRLK